MNWLQRRAVIILAVLVFALLVACAPRAAPGASVPSSVLDRAPTDGPTRAAVTILTPTLLETATPGIDATTATISATAVSAIPTATPSALSRLSPTSPAMPSDLTPVGTIVARVVGTPPPQDLLAYTFADLDHGWAARADGLLATADGGKTWKKLGPAPGNVLRMSAISPTHLWAGTTTGLYRSSDGGVDWSQVPFDAGGERVVIWAEFVDLKHGWIEVHANPSGPNEGQTYLQRTLDGGRTWQTFANPCPRFEWRFGFADATTGWALCGGEPGAGSQAKWLYRSGDGGSSWTKINGSMSESEMTPGYPAGVAATDARHAWIALGYAAGEVLASADGGVSWTSVTNPPDIVHGDVVGFYQPVLLSPSNGFALAWDGFHRAVLATRDGGASWTQIYPALRPTGQITLVDASHGFGAGVVGDAHAILATDDDGKTWTAIDFDGMQVNPATATFGDATHGWLETSDQYGITHWLRTTDGGQTWSWAW